LFVKKNRAIVVRKETRKLSSRWRIWCL